MNQHLLCLFAQYTRPRCPSSMTDLAWRFLPLLLQVEGHPFTLIRLTLNVPILVESRHRMVILTLNIEELQDWIHTLENGSREIHIHMYQVVVIILILNVI